MIAIVNRIERIPENRLIQSQGLLSRHTASLEVVETTTDQQLNAVVDLQQNQEDNF